MTRNTKWTVFKVRPGQRRGPNGPWVARNYSLADGFVYTEWSFVSHAEACAYVEYKS